MDKVILVTGGSRGLGECLVKRLSGIEGTAVYFTYASSGERAAKVEEEASNIYSIKCDQKDEDSVRLCHKAINERHGRLDVLINNACASFMPCDMLESGWGRFQEQLDVNVRGSYYHIREAAALMKLQGEGRIINILSSYVINTPPEKLSFYITAKYALLGMTRAAAAELTRFGITVNAVSPGLMQTELSGYLPPKYLKVCAERHPMKRLTTPSDVADTVEHLVSDKAGFLCGVNIPVNGGESY